MIKPVNGHYLIEPVVHDSFVASQKDTYQEIGVVVATPYEAELNGNGTLAKPGDKVYFDAWLAKKYPKEGSLDYFWLVKWEDVTAIEHAEPK